LERAFKIFNWVNKNIDYKISPENKLETPLSVFTQKEGDCYGYTVLTVYLLRLSGIPAKSVFSYLYNKSRVTGISGDYYHSLVSVHHPLYGWILCEPQKMFFCVTTNHIPIFTEDNSPKSTVRYYEKAGEMEFATDKDEESYQKNKFLEIFIKSDKSGEKRIIESNIKIKGITNIVEFKFISGMNRLYDGYLLDEVELPVSSENSSFIVMNRDTNLTFKLVYEADKQLIHYQNEQNELYTADNGNKFIFGLKKGDYNVFYLRRDIPVEIYRLRVENGIPNFSPSEVNFLLEKGDFKKAVVSIPDLGEMEITKEQTGYIFSKELQYDEKTPIYIDYNDGYFYIFGLKKRSMSITLHSHSGKKVIRDLK
jgi:hypothetical protein